MLRRIPLKKREQSNELLPQDELCFEAPLMINIIVFALLLITLKSWALFLHVPLMIILCITVAHYKQKTSSPLEKKHFK